MADAWLPLREAAERLGVSTDTVRRRLKRGELVGEQRPMAHWPAWFVQISEDVGADGGRRAGEQPGERPAAAEAGDRAGDLVDVHGSPFLRFSAHLDGNQTPVSPECRAWRQRLIRVKRIARACQEAPAA